MARTLRNAVAGWRRRPARQQTRHQAVVIDEIVDLREGLTPQPAEGRLSRPQVGAPQAGYGLALVGWAFDRSSDVTAMEILHGEEVRDTIPLDRQRGDVAAAFPEDVGASVSGFGRVIATADLPRRFELTLIAVFDNGARSPVWRMRGRRAPLLESDQPPTRLRPAVLNGLGRSGTTWLMWLLAHHPEIVVYRPFGREARLAGYWIEVLRNLADPRSHLGALAPRLEGPHWWLGEAHPNPVPAEDAELENAVGGEMLQELAAFGRRRTEVAYSALSRQQGKEGAKMFAEKSFGYPGATRALVRLYDEIYPDSRELLLARDFRDVLCSMSAFDERRGYAAFGRGAAASERDFLSGVNNSALALLERHRGLGDRSTLVHYEELIRQPSSVLTRIFEHLGVDASPRVISDIVRRSAKETSSMERHRTSPDVEASIGRWRRDMSTERAALVNEIVGEALSAYGYAVEPSEGSEPSNDRRTLGPPL